MRTRVKTRSEIEAMREGGKMLALVLANISSCAKAGMSTKDLAIIARDHLSELGGKPAFLGMYGFPDVLCVSINDEVVHGIPSRERVLEEGDIVSCDFGVLHRGMITDSAITFTIGDVDKKAEDLISATKEALMAGVNTLKDGVRIGTIGAKIQNVLDGYDLGIVRTFVGHAVGHELHESPEIANYGVKNSGEKLKAGMTIAIEPMATLGGDDVVVDPDGWTARTKDGSLSAHFEHTILITKTGAEILTEA